MAVSFDSARQEMVAAQLVARGIQNSRVLAAMRAVPRHLFVDTSLQAHAYDDAPLPIDGAQTISQPYMVALMTELLELHETDRVLEIGTGSGYQTAVLSQLAAEVFSVERLDILVERASARLAALGYMQRVRIMAGDGNAGWPFASPFDAIIVTAAVQQIPRPLVEQLADGGRLVLPLGESDLQGLARLRRAGGLQLDYFGECRFVKLIGQYGWEA